MNKPRPTPIKIEGRPPIYWFDSVGSTNTELLNLADEGAEHGTAAVTQFQTHGRGKLERRWLMPPGQGILMSILYREMPQGVQFTQLTLRLGWSLANFLRGLTGLEIDVKKPNDLMIDGKKLVGILSEARWRGNQMLYAVVGIGINVNVTEFPDEIRETATSLALAAGREFDVEELTRALIDHLRSE